MKVLMVNTYDVRGGAARSALRVYSGLKAQGVDIRLMVQNKEGDDPEVLGPNGFGGRLIAKVRPYADFALTFPWHRQRTPFFTAWLPGNFLPRVRRYKPDLIHLNWISGGLLRIEDLAKLDIPVVWTLHDMWAFSGGCHYAADCMNYLSGCGKCPVLKSSRLSDPSRWAFQRKMEAYSRMKNLTLITPSRWLADRVGSSPLLGRFPVKVIPNSLDLKQFFPENKLEARNFFGFPADRKVILFGALDSTRNRLKGFAELSQALGLIREKKGLMLAVFGAGSDAAGVMHGFPVRYFRHISDDAILRRLYSAADVMVVPSIQEVFGQTATEAMACATPVVAFGNTGLADIVEHRVNGFLADPFEPSSLAEGIAWCAGSDERIQNLSGEAVKTVKSKFDLNLNVPRYSALYQDIISSYLKTTE